MRKVLAVGAVAVHGVDLVILVDPAPGVSEGQSLAVWRPARVEFWAQELRQPPPVGAVGAHGEDIGEAVVFPGPRGEGDHAGRRPPRMCRGTPGDDDERDENQPGRYRGYACGSSCGFIRHRLGRYTRISFGRAWSDDFAGGGPTCSSQLIIARTRANAS